MMLRRLVFLLTLVVLCVGYAQSHDEWCDSSDHMQCLSKVREYLKGTSWWFGDGYSVQCPNGTRDHQAMCMNPDPNHKTIISRVLQEDNFDVNKITQLLRVRFNVPAGAYLACDHWVKVPAVHMETDIDPIHTTHLDMWTLDHRPAIIFEAEQDGMYTVVAYDVGNMELGGMWVNIVGSDWSLGEEVYPYRGPLNAFDRKDAYVFVLFKQTDVILDHEVIRHTIHHLNRENKGKIMMNDLNSIVTEISEPMGVGLIVTKGDLYGVQRFKSMNIINNCPMLITTKTSHLQKIVEVHKLDELGVKVDKLDVEVEVNYMSEAIEYEACCYNMSDPEMKIKLDPLSQHPINPVFLRNKPYVRLEAVNKMNTMFFYGKMYTVLLLDVTHAIMTPSSDTTSLLWHVNDIKGQYVTSGMMQMDYLMPIPPTTRMSNSLYTFLVFQQNDTIGSISTDTYCSGDSDCHFKLHNFVKDHNLKLSGVNWFWTRPDIYSRMIMQENSSATMDEACSGVEWYGRPCPDKCRPPPTTPKASTTQPPVITTKYQTDDHGHTHTFTADISTTIQPGKTTTKSQSGGANSGHTFSASCLLLLSTLLFQLTFK